MSNAVLGISAFYHDSAAVLILDGQIVAAAQEERFTRKKHDPDFPRQAVKYVLSEANLTVSNLDVVAFYDKPYLKFERLLETYHAFAPRGFKSFVTAMPVWIKEKLFLRNLLQSELAKLEDGALKKTKILLTEHHQSHAASAFYPSPFHEAAILTVDGVGEWATTTIGYGEQKNITILRELLFPHSIGLLYSAFTYYCGFKVNSGEYKLMGLAPYGNRDGRRVETYKQLILEHLVDIRKDGSILLNMKYFAYSTGSQMCKEKEWQFLFGIPKREFESEITQEYMDLALAIQQIIEQIILQLAQTARALTNCPNLVMAGGVALNCVANGKLIRSGIFDNVWIQPAAGDAGGALGAAYAATYLSLNQDIAPCKKKHDNMAGAFLGPEYSDNDVTRMGRKFGAVYRKFGDFESLSNTVADLIAQGNIVGWFQGRMEWGPRALGNRSILADPRCPEMQKRLNLKIKFREGFRPFAPSVLEEDANTYFELKNDLAAPYMLTVASIRKEFRQILPQEYESLDMYQRLYHPRSEFPAITHVDFSARLQTVQKQTNYRYWKLLTSFKEKTGVGLVVNTSFNVRGEPIVCTPEDAYRCFMNTEMDWLVVQNFLFEKVKQPGWNDATVWQRSFSLD